MLVCYHIAGVAGLNFRSTPYFIMHAETENNGKNTFFVVDGGGGGETKDCIH